MSTFNPEERFFPSHKVYWIETTIKVKVLVLGQKIETYETTKRTLSKFILDIDLPIILTQYVEYRLNGNIVNMATILNDNDCLVLVPKRSHK